MTSRRDKKRRNSLSEHFFKALEALPARGSIPSLPTVDPKFLASCDIAHGNRFRQ